MLADLLRPNPQAKITELTVGDGEHRVVIVDDFYAEPERMVELAHDLHYVHGKVNGNFPGGRAVVSIDTRPLFGVMSQLWGSPLAPYGNEYQPLMLSTIHHGQVELNIAQRSPHIDPGISAMVYLNADADCAGGTGLYRHALTGLERVPIQPTAPLLEFAAEFGYGPRWFQTPEDYTRWQDAMVFNPLFSADEGYINEGNDYWELMYLVEMKFNRLVIFDGRIPHSQYIKDGTFEETIRLNQIAYAQGRD